MEGDWIILLSILGGIFGIFAIILFFKIWKMTDDIKAIKEKILNSDENTSDNF